jgi:hypothetical protein
LKGKDLKILENTQSDSDPDGVPVKVAFALSFLYTFYSVVFMPEINLVLRPILVDGEFQKKENRLEFAESYSNLIKLEDVIKKFESNISPSGEYGERYLQARQDMSSLPVKRRKVQIVLEEVDEDAGMILGQTREAAQIMVYILNGILGNDSRGKYFTLINLQKFTAKDNKFIMDMGETIQKLQKVIDILNDIEDMENGK